MSELVRDREPFPLGICGSSIENFRPSVTRCDVGQTVTPVEGPVESLYVSVKTCEFNYVDRWCEIVAIYQECRSSPCRHV